MMQFTFRAPARLDQYRPLVCCIMGSLATCISDRDALHTVEVILGEACANVIRHAYPDDRKGDMLVSIDLIPSRMVAIRVTDWGVGCTGFALPPHEGESGHGLRIINELADTCVLERREGTTVLHATVRIAEAAWHSSTCNTMTTSSSPS